MFFNNYESFGDWVIVIGEKSDMKLFVVVRPKKNGVIRFAPFPSSSAS